MFSSSPDFFLQVHNKIPRKFS